MARAFISGRMGDASMESGPIMIWKATVFTTGQTVEDMKGNISTIRNADTVSITGLMVEFTKAGGTKVSSTASECIRIPRKRRLNSVCGRTVKE